VLELNTNGLFNASRIPAGMAGVTSALPAPVDGAGKWRIASFEGKQMVYLTFEKIVGAPGAAVPYGLPLEVSGFSSPERLYYFVGDPDEGHTVDFTRRR
jgi:hypothetical protein